MTLSKTVDGGNPENEQKRENICLKDDLAVKCSIDKAKRAGHNLEARSGSEAVDMASLRRTVNWNTLPSATHTVNEVEHAKWILWRTNGNMYILEGHSMIE
ncbi:MAG: hypothetical protein ACUVQ8_03135 [Nitrososphaeria archaeon]